jgi:thiosulfate/3-mercaptopyruvate sulfurtransferase
MWFSTLIDSATLRGLDSRSRVLLDCRYDLLDPDAGRRAYREAHIPGARYADLARDLSGPVTAASGRHPLPAPAALARFFAGAGIAEDSQVVAYDEGSGSFAARAWWLLNWLGATRVAVLDGGFKAWVAGGGPVESGAAPMPVDAAAAAAVAARLTGGVRMNSVATTAEVLQAVGDPGRLLVDARAAERFAGIVEPIDPVAGHVPGAVNHPFSGNLDPDGRFLDPDELRRRWEARLDGRSPDRLIAMCGSGVTACHNLLALASAGLAGGKLYAGSWSEWIRDPDRPVAR